ALRRRAVRRGVPGRHLGGGGGGGLSGLVVAVVGPTATGKSELALALAHRLGGEVVNADSMQLYRGMDIGTAKLPPAQRQGVPHHVLDIWEVTQTASVAEYQRLARAAVDAILARGRVPLVVGGSGLYVRAVLDDLRFPGTDPRLRAEPEEGHARLGPHGMDQRLREVERAGAEPILPSKGGRIVRALEVVARTGRPCPAGVEDPPPHYRWVRIALDRDDVDERIARRVEAMWRA